MANTSVFKIPGYPATILAEDETSISIRPMVGADKDALLEFFRSIPEEDRFYLRDDIALESTIAAWAENLDYSRVVPLLAFQDRQIVAEGTLHYRRRSARRHTGEVRVVVAPGYRDNGIGRGVLRKLTELARDLEVERLLFEVVADKEEAARQAASILGFVPVGVLPGHVRDMDGSPHDLVIMDMDVRQQFPPIPNKF